MFTMAIRKAKIKKISCFVAAVILMIAAIPISSFAVDPISGSIIANAFAQAITGYGAAQGVSMVFDISNTAQIGEGIHELWKQYRAENNEVDDYLDIAAALYPSVFHKIVKAGKAYLGIQLAAEYVADLDGFWNWVMTGPAEMVKVDNQYYQFQQNQQIPIITISGFQSLPLYQDGYTTQQIFNSGAYLFDISNGMPCHSMSKYPAASFVYLNQNQEYVSTFVSYASGNAIYSVVDQGNNNLQQYGTSVNSSTSGIYYQDFYIVQNPLVSIYPTRQDGIDAYIQFVTNGDNSDSLYVAPYIGETVPQDVYIPDNDDVNYDPLPAYIPFDIPWDDLLFGDGTGILSNTHFKNAVDALDGAIEKFKSLFLAGDNAITTDPADTFNSILPFGELPSFNFNLSGIWYYVRNWVASLGSFVTAMFTTWSALPSIITLPVYATAVIVIVLGVYKRFFM